MSAAAFERSPLLPFAAGVSLALAFEFELAEALPTPFTWHFLFAAMLFALGGALHHAFLTALSQRPDRARDGAGVDGAGAGVDMASVVDGGLAMFMWALGALSVVRGVCALLAK